MHCLDFLSEPPKMFIFQKEIAKTNFGGVLFLIYFIIMFFIALVYIVNFAINDKYTYEVKKIDNTTINEEGFLQEEYGFLELNKDEKLNPYVDFSMIIKNFD